jgi:outer membrane protein TolC
MSRRSSINIFYFCGLFLALSPVVKAAPLTVRAAVDQALARNAGLQEAKEKYNQGRFTAWGGWSTLLPAVNLEGSGAHRKDSVANKTPGSVAFGGEPYNLYSVNVKGSQPIFVWGSLAAVRKAGYQRDTEAAELEIAERSAIRETISAFYKVVIQERAIQILLDQEKAVRDALDMAQTRLRLAGGRKLDVLQMRTQLALLKPKIERARIDFATSAANLAHVLGEQEKPELEVRNSIPSLKGKVTPSGDFRLPELERLRLNREIVDSDKSIALGRHLPQVKLLGDYGFLNYTKATLFEEAARSWSVQVMVTLPLFSGLSSIFERRALNAREAQLDFEEVTLRNDLNLKQIESRKSMEAAEASLASAEEAASLAQQSMVQGRQDFRLGIIDFLQYLQVQESQLEAAMSLNQLKYDTIVAYANYYAASGRPLGELVNLLVAEDK